jgi:hypothetical protein
MNKKGIQQKQKQAITIAMRLVALCSLSSYLLFIPVILLFLSIIARFFKELPFLHLTDL